MKTLLSPSKNREIAPFRHFPNYFEKMVHNENTAAFAQGKIVIHLDSAIKNRKCFFDLFAARCKACNHPITSNYISALDGHWHNECFTCRVSREGNMPVLSR